MNPRVQHRRTLSHRDRRRRREQARKEPDPGGDADHLRRGLEHLLHLPGRCRLVARPRRPVRVLLVRKGVFRRLESRQRGPRPLRPRGLLHLLRPSTTTSWRARSGKRWSPTSRGSTPTSTSMIRLTTSASTALGTPAASCRPRASRRAASCPTCPRATRATSGTPCRPTGRSTRSRSTPLPPRTDRSTSTRTWLREGTSGSTGSRAL